MVLSRAARRHREADRRASLSTLVSAISPALLSLAHLPRHESLPISRSSQVIPPLEPPLAGLELQSTETNSDGYEFGYPQDLYPPSDSFTYMDLDDTLSNDGSQGIDYRAGQIESWPKTPDNAQLHEEYSRGPQIQPPGNSPPPSLSLSGSSNSATDETEELGLATAFRENPAIRLLYLQTVVADIFVLQIVDFCS